MNRSFLRPVAVAVAAATCVGFLWSDRPFSGPLQAQGPERLPGPIIEDPPGPYVGQTYVPIPQTNLVAPGAALSTFVVTYNGFTPQAQIAFQAAVDIWALQLQSTVPIHITANWTVLSPDVLGSAGPTFIFRDFPGALFPSTWFPVALANKQSGTDLAPGDADIIANFNSSFDWYLGTDGNAGAEYDLMTVVLHELGHGLGVFGSMNGSGGSGSWGYSTGFPVVYDRFAINGSSQFLIDTSVFPNPSAALGAQLSGNNLFFNGLNARNGNGGAAARLYAPNPWASGSSYSHLNEVTFPAGNPNSLMTPFLGAGEAVHDPGAVVRGLLSDIGWTIVQTAPGTTDGDFDGDGKSDITVFRPWTGTWYVLGSSVSANYVLGGDGDTPVAADYDGDGKTDVAIFRPWTGAWYLRYSSTGSGAVVTWGGSGDLPVPGDYDGDGITDIAVFRPWTSTWYIRGSSVSANYLLGDGTDIPVPGDYDGDGKTDIAVFRPSTGAWYLRYSSTGSGAVVAWGGSGDRPVIGDYDGDGITDIAVFRPWTSTWYIRGSSVSANYVLGDSTDVPVPGDYDGDGKTDIAVFRPSTGAWYLRYSSTGSGAVAMWGSAGDIPILKVP